MQSLKQFARKFKNEVYAVYLATKDSRTPWYAKVLAGIVVAYAFSPLDLIPDPIPILGYLDDLVFVPFGIWCILKLIPPQVMVDCRKQAESIRTQGKPKNWWAAGIVVLIWITIGVLIVFWLKAVLKR